MSLTKVVGTVSGIRQSVSDAKIGEIVGTHQVFTFRVDGQGVEIRTKLSPDIQEGDHLTLVGHEKQGMFHALAFRNEATRRIWSTPAGGNLLVGGIVTVFSLPLTLILIGFLTLPFGVITLNRGINISNAVKMLKG